MEYAHEAGSGSDGSGLHLHETKGHAAPVQPSTGHRPDSRRPQEMEPVAEWRRNRGEVFESIDPQHGRRETEIDFVDQSPRLDIEHREQSGHVDRC